MSLSLSNPPPPLSNSLTHSLSLSLFLIPLTYTNARTYSPLQKRRLKRSKVLTETLLFACHIHAFLKTERFLLPQTNGTVVATYTG